MDILQPHISLLFQERIQFVLFRFQSPLLTESLLVSFPAGTKTFQFPAFPLLTELMGSPIQESLVQWSHTPRQSFVQFVTPFFGFQAKSSTVQGRSFASDTMIMHGLHK